MKPKNKPKSFSSYGRNSNRNPKHGKSTVNWSAMYKPRFSEEHKTAHLDKLDDVKSYFQGLEIVGPIVAPWHNGSTRIVNVAKFVESHCQMVEANAGRSWLAGPYLRRLVDLMEWHKEQKAIAA